MKKLILIFIASSVLGQNNSYQTITERNAFGLAEENAVKVDLPPVVLKSPVKLHLTGIMKYQGLTNVFLYSKDLSKRFLTLNHKKPTDSGIELLSVKGSRVKIMNNGVIENLSFETHKLPTVMGPAPVFNRPTVIKKDSKDDKNKNKEKKSAPAPRPSVVKVPSRSRNITDPRMQQMMERGLEYLNKIDDPEKKQAMLERLEKFQRGDYDKEIRERMQKYEEYRKSRDRKK
tara:strand:+ start:295 stop:987 length:693 start_codon:yes stop_codon:yes gene_type:complete